MALGTAMKVVGTKSMAQYLTDVDNQKMAKVGIIQFSMRLFNPMVLLSM